MKEFVMTDPREVAEMMKKHAAARGRPFDWAADAPGMPEAGPDGAEDPDAADQDELMAEAMLVLEDGGTDEEVADAWEAAFDFRPTPEYLAELRRLMEEEGDGEGEGEGGYFPGDSRLRPADEEEPLDPSEPRPSDRDLELFTAAMRQARASADRAEREGG